MTGILRVLRIQLPHELRAAVESAIEMAYRRGYAQAAYCAARDAAQGLDLKAWARACDQWRHAARFGPRKWAEIGTCPPEPWELERPQSHTQKAQAAIKKVAKTGSKEVGHG